MVTGTRSSCAIGVPALHYEAGTVAVIRAVSDGFQRRFVCQSRADRASRVFGVGWPCPQQGVRQM